MRHIALGIIALLGASLPVAAAEPEVISAPQPTSERFGRWTGGYVTLSAGYGWLKDFDERFAPPLESAGQDVVFGMSAGYLHEFGHVVVGAEAGYQYQRIVFEGLPAFFPLIRSEEAWALRGRLGVSYDRLLVTANLGAIYANTNIGMEDWGWALGASADYLVTDNVFAGLGYEHQFYRNFDGVPLDADVDTVNLRLGYKF